MTDERWKELMDDFKSSLTEEEIAEGWHFCHEFDGLLVQGDPNEPCCGESCINVPVIVVSDYSRNGSE